MSRVLFVSLGEEQVTAQCLGAKVGISSLETLPSGGVRLVCMSSEGAARLRSKLRSKLMQDDVLRVRHRPSTPLW